MGDLIEMAHMLSLDELQELKDTVQRLIDAKETRDKDNTYIHSIKPVVLETDFDSDVYTYETSFM